MDSGREFSLPPRPPTKGRFPLGNCPLMDRKSREKGKRNALAMRFMFCTAAERKDCSYMLRIPSMRAWRRPCSSLASAKDRSMVSLRRAQMRLPLFVFVNASACSNASCRTWRVACRLPDLAGKHSARLGQSLHVLDSLQYSR